MQPIVHGLLQHWIRFVSRKSSETRWRRLSVFALTAGNRGNTDRDRCYREKNSSFLCRQCVSAIEILHLEQVCWHRSRKYFGGKNTL
jgi:hypothetical protein